MHIIFRSRTALDDKIRYRKLEWRVWFTIFAMGNRGKPFMCTATKAKKDFDRQFSDEHGNLYLKGLVNFVYCTLIGVLDLNLNKRGIFGISVTSLP